MTAGEKRTSSRIGLMMQGCDGHSRGSEFMGHVGGWSYCSPAGYLKVEGFGFLYEVELQGLEKILPLSTEDLQCCDTTGIF